jgi:hypothetical protein
LEYWDTGLCVVEGGESVGGADLIYQLFSGFCGGLSCLSGEEGLFCLKLFVFGGIVWLVGE